MSSHLTQFQARQTCFTGKQLGVLGLLAVDAPSSSKSGRNVATTAMKKLIQVKTVDFAGRITLAFVGWLR